jgi:hypothetical protein
VSGDQDGTGTEEQGDLAEGVHSDVHATADYSGSDTFTYRAFDGTDYGNVATVTIIVDPVNDRARQQAEDVYRRLRNHAREMERGSVTLLGPVPPFFNRIDGRYRWQIVVRSEDPTALLSDFPIGPNWLVDIDPVSTL